MGMRKNAKYYRREDLEPQTAGNHRAEIYLNILFNRSALHPQEVMRVITTAHKKHGGICLLEETVFSYYHSSVQHQRFFSENYSIVLIARSSGVQWTAQGDSLAYQKYLLSGCRVVAAVLSVFIG